MFKCILLVTIQLFFLNLIFGQQYFPDSSYAINAVSIINADPKTPRKILKYSNGKKIIISTNLICRIDSFGNLDNTFGMNGLIMDTNLYIKNSGITDANGRLLVCGEYYNNYFVKRYKINGELDSTFGINGISNQYIPYDEVLYDLVIQSDGKIIAAGMTTNASFNKKETILIRLNDNGSIDSTFGTNGVKVNGFTFENFARLNKLLLLPDGKILAGGTVYSSHYRSMLLRYQTNGSLDSSFGNNGYKSYPYLGPTSQNESYLFDLALQADGKVIACGYASELPEPYANDAYSFAIRVKNNGEYDLGFGNSGIHYSPSNSTTKGLSTIEILNDGKILISTIKSSPYKGIIYKLNTMGIIDSTFGQDGALETNGAEGFCYEDSKIYTFYNASVPPNTALKLTRWKPNLYPTNLLYFNQESIDFTVYPSIFENTVQVKFNDKKIFQPVLFQLIDFSGRHFQIEAIQSNHPENLYYLNFSNTLPAGNYFLLINQSGKIYSRQIIKKG